jgi:hypothetical protein
VTGRYLIYTPVESVPDERGLDIAWRRFPTVCRSLHNDALPYSFQFNLTAATPHVLITASGTALTAEAKYRRELDLISGQRQQFKPGPTDEPRYADDEVAA